MYPQIIHLFGFNFKLLVPTIFVVNCWCTKILYFCILPSFVYSWKECAYFSWIVFLNFTTLCLVKDIFFNIDVFHYTNTISWRSLLFLEYEKILNHYFFKYFPPLLLLFPLILDSYYRDINTSSCMLTSFFLYIFYFFFFRWMNETSKSKILNKHKHFPKKDMKIFWKCEPLENSECKN